MPRLDKDLAAELINLVHDYERETEPQYLAVVRRCAKLRSLIKGNPADWYAPDAREWRGWAEHPDYNPEDSKYNHNINFSSAWWKILQSAVQTIGIPGAVFRPQNPRQQSDREASAIGKQIADYQRTTVDFRDLMMGIYRLGYTDGLVLAFTRHVRDATKYGETNIPEEIVETRVIREAGFKCFQCEGEFPPDGILRAPSGDMACPNCGSPLHEENFMDVETGPVVVGHKDKLVPNGREVTDLYGALESLMPWFAKDLEHAHWGMIKTGMPKEEIIAAFPDLEDEIEGSGSDIGKAGTMERESARAPQGAGGVREAGFPTYYRVWFRPTCFYRIGDKEKRNRLLELYPEGIFFQLANEVFLDTDEKRGCWGEKMEKRLTLIRPFKGDGMYTPSIGQDGVPIHESGQTAWNMALEGMEHAAFPQGLLDDSIFSGQAVKDTKVRAGTWKLMHLTGGKKLRESWDQMKSQDISASVQSFLQMPQPMAEFLLGTVNAIQGLPITNVRTSSGQAQSRNQGLQRQAPIYGAVKDGLARIQGQLVNEFLEHQNPETYYEVTGDKGEMEERKIQLGPERGKVVAYPEVSEAIPQTWAQKQDTSNKILESQSPVVQGWVAHPKNARVFFESIGFPELTVPGKELADKYDRLIEEFLRNPQEAAEKPFDAVLDVADIAIAVIQEWAASREGLTAQKDNPQGFAAVRAFAEQALKAKMDAQPKEPPPPPPDPQKLEIAKMQEENKRAIADMEVKAEVFQEQLKADTDKFLQDREEAHEMVMQRLQQGHERELAESNPSGGSQQ